MALEGRDPLPLARLFDERVATAQVWLGTPALSPLLPGEEATLGTARPERLEEFRAGRHCARAALERLGVSRAPIPRKADRSPEWPAEVRGTIAHVTSWLGLDVELDAPLRHELWDRILTASELAHLEREPASERGLLAKMIFSAKESVYKAQHPVTEQFLEFSDVELEWSEDAFIARILPEPAASLIGMPMRGRILRGEGLVVTAVCAPSSP
jgi:4'-phosphopantetheinyl transferase EntD